MTDAAARSRLELTSAVRPIRLNYFHVAVLEGNIQVAGTHTHSLSDSSEVQSFPISVPYSRSSIRVGKPIWDLPCRAGTVEKAHSLRIPMYNSNGYIQIVPPMYDGGTGGWGEDS